MSDDFAERSARKDQDGPDMAPLRRERVIDALCEAYARDELGIEELERRLDRANRARTEADLRDLLGGLDLSALEAPPAIVGETTVTEERSSPPLERTHEAAGTGIRRIDASQVPDRQVSVGIWSGHVRRGSWIPARSMTAIALMGGVEMDFREAILGPEPVELRAAALMGGIALIVPPDLRVETSGFAIMGGFEDHSQISGNPNSGAPTLRVRGVALMGAVSIEVRLPGESARDARRRRKREGRE